MPSADLIAHPNPLPLDTDVMFDALLCPACGSESISHSKTEITCLDCGRSADYDGQTAVWDSEGNHSPRSRASLIAALRYYTHPFASPFSPLTHITRKRVDQYYERARSNESYASQWADHYLAGLDLPAGSRVLDHGCGRGRAAALFHQLGYQVFGQEMNRNPWWSHLGNARFQVVQPGCSHLPWQAESFDLAINNLVLGHMDRNQLESHASEVFRVLKPGGCWLILEANAASWGAHVPRRWYGRMHTLDDVSRVSVREGFVEISREYEGFYAPVFPVACNFIRKSCAPWAFDMFDNRSWVAAMVPDRKRANWVLKVQKAYS